MPKEINTRLAAIEKAEKRNLKGLKKSVQEEREELLREKEKYEENRRKQNV